MEEKNKKDINRRDFIKIVGISAAIDSDTIRMLVKRHFFIKQCIGRRGNSYR